MSDLRDRLARSGLSLYYEVFVAEGFDTWETVLDITELDLSQLNVKLGHRRKLQRAIAESRGFSSDRPLSATLGRAASVEESYRSDDSGPESKNRAIEIPSVAATGTAIKRKYRRHPKPDEHAPERPPSAYVIFSNRVRESLKGKDLSFTGIAKVVGERWQVLPTVERESYERQASSAKDKYYTQLADYKRTPQFQIYQKYLEDFKAKHAAPTKGKRSRVEPETSTSTRSNSHDHRERSSRRRSSPVAPFELIGGGLRKTTRSPPMGPSRLPTGPFFANKPASPTSRSFSGFNSPAMGDQFSPICSSPRPAIFKKESSFESIINTSGDRKSMSDTIASYYSYPDTQHQSSSTTSSALSHTVNNATSFGLTSRRPLRESAQLPPLTHEDTTWSSESGSSTQNIASLRILPAPVPLPGSASLPLDRLPLSHIPLHPQPQLPIPLKPQDDRTQGPLAVLVRAGELVARAQEYEVMEEDGI